MSNRATPKNKKQRGPSGAHTVPTYRSAREAGVVFYAHVPVQPKRRNEHFLSGAIAATPAGLDVDNLTVAHGNPIMLAPNSTTGQIGDWYDNVVTVKETQTHSAKTGRKLAKPKTVEIERTVGEVLVATSDRYRPLANRPRRSRASRRRVARVSAV